MQEVRPGHHIYLVQFWMCADTWFRVGRGSPRKWVQHSGSVELEQNGQQAVLFITGS